MRAELIAFLVATGCPRPLVLRPEGTLPDEKDAGQIIDRMSAQQLTTLEASMRAVRASEPLHTFEYHPYDRSP